MYRLKYLFIGLLSMVLMSCQEKANEFYLFVGSYTEEAEAGIHLYLFDEETGAATLVNSFSGIENPSYLAISEDGQFVYSVSETDVPDAKVCAYSFDRSTGELSLLNEQKTEGSAPCYIWVDSKRRMAVTANYSGGSISAFPIAADGTLQPPQLYTYEGEGSDAQRQKASHLHCIYASPDEKYLFANDLGRDRIYKYALISSGNKLSLQEGAPASCRLPEGEGPRHTVFHPNGRWAYLISELSGRVAFMDYSDGHLTPSQFIEADTLHVSGSADIHISPDGRFLYASNRLKGDGIAIFSISPSTGRLTKAGYQPTGIHPRNFILTPNGQFLLCACRDSNVVQIYKIDKQSGLLKETGKEIRTSKPVCLKLTLKFNS